MFLDLGLGDTVFEKNPRTDFERGQDRSFYDGDPVTIIPREDWGSLPLDEDLPRMPGGVVKHVLHNYRTDTNACHSVRECSVQLQRLQFRCLEKHNTDIFYNFLIGGDGNVYECRGWTVLPDTYRRLADVMDPATMYVGYIGDLADTAAGKITIVKREWWKALPPKKVGAFDNTKSIRYIIYSHTGGHRCRKKADCVKIVQDLQKQHMDWGMPDIRYSFLIGGDNNIYEGRGFAAKPVINRGNPELYGKSIEVAYIGDYREAGLWAPKKPTRKMWDKGWQIIRHGSDTGMIPEFELRWYFDSDSDDRAPWGDTPPPLWKIRWERSIP